jgi:endonuclease/exonuclease/phosphatase family metal-dependent hydrolase
VLNVRAAKGWIDRGGALVLAALLVGVGAKRCGAPSLPPSAVVRVATYNVRFFGKEPTDQERLRAVVSSVDPAVLALEELVVDSAAETLAESLSVGGRSYRVAAASCGGRSGLRVAFVYDASRVEWRETREFAAMEPDGNGACTAGDRAALAGTFTRRGDPTGQRTTLVAVHLAARSDPERVEQRRAQWRRLFSLVERLRREGHGRVLILGDANSTGWRDDAHGERTFIAREAEGAGLRVETAGLACSEYYRRDARGLEPSMLDHVLAPPGAVRPGTVRLHGYCAAYACQRLSSEQTPREYTTVSDHCPVSVDLAD